MAALAVSTVSNSYARCGLAPLRLVRVVGSEMILLKLASHQCVFQRVICHPVQLYCPELILCYACPLYNGFGRDNLTTESLLASGPTSRIILLITEQERSSLTILKSTL